MKRLLLLLAVLVSAVALAGRAIAQDGHGDTHAPAAQDSHAHDDHGHDDHAHAAHDEAGVIPTIKQGLATGLAALIVFTFVFIVLAVKVWPKIVKGLDDRASKIREEIAAAEAARRQAKDALELYEKNLAQARAEAQKMLEETKAQQGKLAADLKAKADVELGQMRERAMKDIDSAKRVALAEIYSEAANLATLVASKILQRQITPEDHKRLVEQSLAELQSVSN